MHSPSQPPKSTQNPAETEPWCITLEYSERDGDHHATTSTDPPTEGETQALTPEQRRKKNVLTAAMRTVVGAGLQQLERAIDEGDIEQVRATFNEFKRAYHLYEALNVGHIQKPLMDTLARRHDGKKGGRPPLDWEAICRDYDQWMSEGIPRAKVVTRLATKHDISKKVINQGLRKRGRGGQAQANQKRQKNMT